MGNLTRIEYFILYFGGVIALAMSVVLSLFATKLRWFEFRPYPRYVNNVVLNPHGHDYENLLTAGIIQMTSAFQENNKVNESKANRINWSFVSFVVGIILLLSYAVIFSLFHEIIPSTNSQNGNGNVTVSNDTLSEVMMHLMHFG